MSNEKPKADPQNCPICGEPDKTGKGFSDNYSPITCPYCGLDGVYHSRIEESEKPDHVKVVCRTCKKEWHIRALEEIVPELRHDITMVVPCFNRADMTRQLLRSWHEKTENVPHRLILVDQASKDDTAQVLADYAALMEGNDNVQVEVVTNPRNVGVNGSVNQEFVRVPQGTKYVGKVDNDAELPYGWLATLKRALDEVPNWGIVSACIQGVMGLHQNERPRKTIEGWKIIYPWRIGGLCYLMRWQSYQTCGRMYDGQIVGRGWQEYQERVRKAGWEVAYLLDVIAVHLGEGEQYHKDFDDYRQWMFRHRRERTISWDDVTTKKVGGGAKQ